MLPCMIEKLQIVPTTTVGNLSSGPSSKPSTWYFLIFLNKLFTLWKGSIECLLPFMHLHICCTFEDCLIIFSLESYVQVYSVLILSTDFYTLCPHNIIHFSL